MKPAFPVERTTPDLKHSQQAESVPCITLESDRSHYVSRMSPIKNSQVIAGDDCESHAYNGREAEDGREELRRVGSVRCKPALLAASEMMLDLP